MSELHEIARALVADGRESSPPTSSGTIKRFDSIGVESTEENRAYRDLLFTTEGAEEFISGVILYDETIRRLRGRHAVQAAREQGDHRGSRSTPAPAAGGLARGDDHRGPGRPPRAARGVTASWAPSSRSGGRCSRSAPAGERVRDLDERACARAVRSAEPGGRARSRSWSLRS